MTPNFVDVVITGCLMRRRVVVFFATCDEAPLVLMTRRPLDTLFFMTCIRSQPRCACTTFVALSHHQVHDC